MWTEDLETLRETAGCKSLPTYLSNLAFIGRPMFSSGRPIADRLIFIEICLLTLKSLAVNWLFPSTSSFCALTSSAVAMATRGNTGKKRK